MIIVFGQIETAGESPKSGTKLSLVLIYLPDSSLVNINQ